MPKAGRGYDKPAGLLMRPGKPGLQENTVTRYGLITVKTCPLSVDAILQGAYVPIGVGIPIDFGELAVRAVSYRRVWIQCLVSLRQQAKVGVIALILEASPTWEVLNV